MPQHLTYRGVVYPWHCDHVGHMNVMWYTGKFDEATWGFMAMLGVTPTYLREAGRGMAAVDQHTTYQRELLAGDAVEVRTELVEVRERVLRFTHVMHKVETGDVCATTTLTGVHLDAHTRRAVAFPEAIREAAAALLPRAAAYASKAM